MSIIATEGWDMFNGLDATTGIGIKWFQSFAAFNTGILGFSLVTGRFGGQALKYDSTTNFGRAVAFGFTGTSTISIGFAFRVDTFGTITGSFPLLFTTSGNFQFAFSHDPNGQINIIRTNTSGTGTTVASSAAGVLKAGAWNYFVLTVSMGTTTTGAVSLYMNGSPTPILSASNINLLNFTTSNLIDTIHYGGARGDNRLGSWTMDDLWIDNTVNNLGERRIEVLRPSADVSVQFTPNSGVTNFSRVNETLIDGDTSYVSGTNVGDRDLYSLGALSSTPATIDAVTVVAVAEKTDAGTRAIYNSVKSNTTDSDGSSFTLGSTYQRFDRVMLTNPDGGGSWTASAVNALKVGPKVAV